jgi:2-polyprenyl-3-methyl-5-hydroxy-6-metoxy-1,4-benzoquinol methylase
MNDSNSKTLLSYNEHVREYVDGTLQIVTGAAKDWIDAAIDNLPLQAKILELGSAFGRDATYIASKGFAVECTDATEGFVSLLQTKGFNARLLNVLSDDLTDKYDLIFANAVMLHFTQSEFSFVLKKLFHSLNKGGRFAFSLKRGKGESWSNEKLGAPRFFCYWEKANLEPLIIEAGFVSWTIDEAVTQRVHAEWLFIIATAP